MTFIPVQLHTTFTLLFALILNFSLFSQSKTAQLNGDCANAVEIIPTGTYNFKQAPIGYGNVLEISHNSSTSPYYFKEENNTAWFTFIAKRATLLTFEIRPTNINTDFDFLVFEYTDTHFCEDIKHKKIKPLRTNISRFDTSQVSVTGLAVNATKAFIKSGIGNNFSKALQTEEGKRYYIVINNVYGTQAPFSIIFKHYTTLLISGTLLDENTNKPLGNVPITWEDHEGNLLAETKTDSRTGHYKFQVPVLKSRKPKPYILTAINKDYNFKEQIVLTSQKDSIKHVNILIPKLIAGEKMNLYNIHFYGDKAIPLPNAKKSMKRLYQFMKNHKNLTIRIEGHTNGCNGNKLISQKLSNNRALAIKDFLVAKDIDQKRIKTIGYGCLHMLYPISSTEEKQSLNRRVEFVILGFEPK